MKKLVSGMVVLVAGSFLVGCFLQRHALACELLPVLDYQQVHPRVNGEIFVEAGMSLEQIDSVTAMVSLAVARIDAMYPENIDLSEADILAVQSLNSARRFFSGNTRQHYQAARMAVEPLIHEQRFFHDLNRIASGESFETVFLDAR